MAGVKALRKIQITAETTAGTQKAATTIWRGTGTLEDKTEVTFPEEDVGILGGADRSYIAFQDAGLALDATPATFEQLPHILEMGVMTATPTQDGTEGSGYAYAYTLPTTAVPTIKTYSIEGGDNQQEEEGAYFFCEDFKLEGKPREAVMMSANLRGRSVGPESFTTTATLPEVEEILFQKGKLYIDDVDGTLGETQKSATLLGFSLDVKTGLVPVFAGDGNLYFSFVKSTAPEVTLQITFEHDGTAVAEKAAWRAQTPRQIRLLFEGSALTTAGTYTYKTLIIDVAGKWQKFDKLAEQDGNDIVTGTLLARYNATADLFTVLTVVNELSALP